MRAVTQMYSLLKTVLIFNLLCLCILFLIRQLNDSTLIADQILAVGLFALVCTGTLFVLSNNNISSEKKWVKILSNIIKENGLIIQTIAPIKKGHKILRSKNFRNNIPSPKNTLTVIRALLKIKKIRST